MNRVATSKEAYTELAALLTYMRQDKPSRQVLAGRLRALADRVAAKSWTVKVQNHALQSGHWFGNFSSEQEAVDWAKKEAKRTRKFMEYTVCEGTSKDPGKATKNVFHGDS